MYKKILIFLYNFYFKIFKINNSQSLKYQAMIFLMHTHKLKRLNLIDHCDYIGDDTISINNNDWEIISTKTIKIISNNYSILFIEYSPEEIQDFLFELLEINDNDNYYTLSDNGSNNVYELEFTMKNKGYSYQYNGYKKSEIKLQEKANLFALITLIGATFVWLENKNYINLETDSFYIFSVYTLIFTIFIFRNHSWLLKLILSITIIGFIIA